MNLIDAAFEFRAAAWCLERADRAQTIYSDETAHDGFMADFQRHIDMAMHHLGYRVAPGRDERIKDALSAVSKTGFAP